ncbi:MAG: phosphate ABC transporter substrate-binding protein PstS [Thiohalocapsa sp.]|uniref:phosphate ABC transporter substrate-binding protein PstS n=1 Tax=Thiohalocapsa sp. TaxID=2497641 RepID=UPI0025E150FA|nr:phosphate ABC transporter substrate-binding protein PstS [Thiohalocapsa sp.]MCG6940102.1 phosphate ABC transporter substrate-binding protein PstS [Thiohalocapsa sp.]
MQSVESVARPMVTRRAVARTVLAAVAVVALASCSQQEGNQAQGTDGPDASSTGLVVRGAGATFPKPLYEKWISIYGKQTPDVSFEYAGVGSGKGIQMFLAGKDPDGTVFDGAEIDFGASDAAMSDADLAKVGERGAVMVPMTGGMVVLAYNLPGVEELKLSREAVQGIFNGEIQNWNDPLIAASNPDLDLPNRSITPVVRRDSSGTTFIMTSHLAAVSPAWRNGPGVGKQIDWPGSTMQVNYNSGVAQRVKVSEGAIGYMEYEFAERLGLPIATLQNKAGEYVKPTPVAGSAALASAPSIPDDLRVFVPDPPGAGAYPIAGYTWLLLYQHYPDTAKRDALKGAVLWGLNEGQPVAEEMGYIPLPTEMVRLARAKVDAID